IRNNPPYNTPLYLVKFVRCRVFSTIFPERFERKILIRIYGLIKYMENKDKCVYVN
ncbi:hypothetical protein L9F63_016112, partial [Diploptera punctata]